MAFRAASTPALNSPRTVCRTAFCAVSQKFSCWKLSLQLWDKHLFPKVRVQLHIIILDLLAFSRMSPSFIQLSLS